MKLGSCVGGKLVKLGSCVGGKLVKLCNCADGKLVNLGNCVGGMGEACYLLKGSTQAGWLQYTVFWSLKGQSLHSVTQLTQVRYCQNFALLLN